MNIQWEYHMAYQPTAARAIKRFNSLLQTKLASRNESSSLAQELMNCMHALNIRLRLSRESLIQEAIKYNTDINYPIYPNEAG